jgi:hypothetical protein
MLLLVINYMSDEYILYILYNMYILYIKFVTILFSPMPVAARSVASVCGHSLAGIAGSNPAGGHLLCVVCCQVGVSATG